MSPEVTNESKQSTPYEFLTPENFLNTWGEKIGFTPDEFRDLWSTAELFYTDLPYHNWLHVRKVLFGTMLIADAFEANGVDLDRSFLIPPTFFHDAKFQDNHTVLGFTTKENHSIDIFEDQAKIRGYTGQAKLIGKQAIFASTAGVEAVSEYDVALVCADLLGAASDFETIFMPDGDNLSKEWNIMNPEKQKDREQYIDFTIGLLSTYAVINLGSTKYSSAYDPRVWIRAGIKENVVRLAVDRSTKLGLSLPDYANQHCNDFPAAGVLLAEAA